MYQRRNEALQGYRLSVVQVNFRERKESMKMTKKKDKSVNYRLSEDIESAIKSLAVKSRKEVSQLVWEILQNYIDEEKEK